MIFELMISIAEKAIVDAQSIDSESRRGVSLESCFADGSLLEPLDAMKSVND